MTSPSPDLASLAAAFVRSADYVDLTVRQLAVLALLDDADRPLHVRELAAALELAKPVISRALQKLEPLGLAERRIGADRRDRLACITTRGRVLRCAFRALAHDHDPADEPIETVPFASEGAL